MRFSVSAVSMQPQCIGNNVFVSIIDDRVRVGLHSNGACTRYNVELTKEEFLQLKYIRTCMCMRPIDVSDDLTISVRWKWIVLNKQCTLALTKYEWHGLQALIPYAKRFL